MPSKVKVTITSRVVGDWTTAPYSHRDGLDPSAIYVVPTYAMIVGDSHHFEVIRFGLVNRGQKPPPNTRVCDAGLADEQSARPTWIPTYSPHSFTGSARPGAWQLYPGKSWLIHEGADDQIRTIGGSLGCIEVVGMGEWNRFLRIVESLSGADVTAIGRAKSMYVSIEAASRPAAMLRT